MRILAVTDEVDRRLYGQPGLRQRVGSPDLIVGCGDLPGYYLDYLVSHLDAPLYAVHGNHDTPPDRDEAWGLKGCGATWIGGRVVRVGGLLLAGFDGCVRYNDGAYQSTQAEMRASVARLAPRLWLNRIRHGRALDVLVTHAPPAGVHEGSDPAHLGFTAFRWLLETFRPRYHLHGHAHVFDRRTPTQTTLGATQVINVYPYRELVL
jgi:Icc-related predicted phosphoesterase